jgi:hypothetical protein
MVASCGLITKMDDICNLLENYLRSQAVLSPACGGALD